MISIATSGPFISGMTTVDDDNVHWMGGSQFQSFAAAQSRQNGVPKGFEEPLFALQYGWVVIDAQTTAL